MKLVTSSLALAFAVALVMTACATREVPVEVTREVTVKVPKLQFVTRAVEQTVEVEVTREVEVEVSKGLVEPDILIRSGVYKDYRTKYTRPMEFDEGGGGFGRRDDIEYTGESVRLRRDLSVIRFKCKDITGTLRAPIAYVSIVTVGGYSRNSIDLSSLSLEDMFIEHELPSFPTGHYFLRVEGCAKGQAEVQLYPNAKTIIVEKE